METIEKIYKIGYGPSSSHTMGPLKAARIFTQRHPDANLYRVTLYGSLAATGKGHLTDKAILKVIEKDKLDLVWEPKVFLPFHSNGMTFEALDAQGLLLGEWITYSVGGGDIANETTHEEVKKLYDMNTMNDILKWCRANGRTFWEYVEICEGPEICDYLTTVWTTMKDAIQRGLENEGVLPGIIKLPRKASSYLIKAKSSQGEIGTACAMASGAATQLFGGAPAQIEYASEMGLEHHLGLTCDPVAGLVQIPCIERNAFAAARALDSSAFAVHSDGSHLVSFDKVVTTMKQTGKDLPSIYKETSEGGLAIFASDMEE